MPIQLYKHNKEAYGAVLSMLKKQKLQFYIKPGNRLSLERQLFDFRNRFAGYNKEGVNA